MEANSIGLDIGSSAVRAAEIRIERHHCRLRRYAQVGLPSGAVVDGEVVNPLVVAEALRRLWDAGDFSSRKVVLGVSGHRLIVRQADVPALNEEDLRSSLRFDAQELIPIPMEDAHFDFQILERGDSTDDDGRATMRILIVAAHREMLKAHLAALEQAGLEAVAVDASPLALMRVVPPAADSGVEAIVSIGAELTTVAVRQAGIPRFIRSLAIGGGKLTAGIASALHVEPAIAETLKRGAVPNGTPQLAQARKAMGSELRDLGEDVRATMDFFLSQAVGGPIDRLLITGGASMTVGLAEELAGTTDVDIRRIDPFAVVTLDDLGLDEDALRRARATSATAVGLALWTADAPGRRLSVLPGDVAEARRTRRLAILAAAGVAGVAGLLAFVGGAEAVAVHLERSKVHEAQAKAASLQAKVTQLQVETAIHTRVAARAHLVKSALQGDVDWVSVISGIQNSMPASLQIESFTGTRGSTSSASSGSSTGSIGVSLTGNGGLPVTAAWLDGLQKDPSVQGTWVTGIAETTNGGAVTFASTTSLTPNALSHRDRGVNP
ncbi:MAG TPA: type IV pilus assembly protein PilM [Acidimicrobiales bacterium]